jgi:hypothetical protein
MNEQTTGERIRSVQTRFLFPFFFAEGSAAEGARALLEGRLGTMQPWVIERPHHLYGDELLGHVAAWLFPEEELPGVCRYLRLRDDVASRIFQSLVARTGAEEIPVALARPATCEIFLTAHGAGLLSLALEPRSVSATLETALNFNRRGADRHAEGSLRLCKPHPSEDAARWSSIPQEQRARIVPAPPETAPLEDRLGAPGGAFFLDELVDALLTPLRRLHLKMAHAAGHVASVPAVYTVVRLQAADVDFDSVESRRTLGPALAALAQIEEPGHAGAAHDELGIPTTVLNRKHWTGVSQLGSAHLLADQIASPGGKDVAFNEERAVRVLLKYFVPFLVAFLQRLVTQHALGRAAAAVASAGQPRTIAEQRSSTLQVSELREALLTFAVHGNFTQVSTRHALHRYYQLAREGLDVVILWEDARRAVADLDARRAAETQLQLTEGMSKSLVRGNEMQHALHTIEKLIAAVYAADLVFMIAEALYFHDKPKEFRIRLAVIVGVAALLGFAVAHFIIARNEQRSRDDAERE